MNQTSAPQKAAATLHEMMEGLKKFASNGTQTITHLNIETGQKNLGKEMSKEIDSTPGIHAGNPGEVPAPSNEPKDQEGGVQESTVASGAQSMAASGSTVKNITPEGKPSGTPEQASKAAALADRLKVVQSALNTQTVQERIMNQTVKTAAAADFVTGTEVMSKVASLAEHPDNVFLKQDFESSFQKLASGNPAFAIAFENALLRKKAEEIDAVTAQTGMSDEDAAQLLDAATANDPAAEAELEEEAAGEALTDLAEAEAAADDIYNGLNEAAAQATERSEPVSRKRKRRKPSRFSTPQLPTASLLTRFLKPLHRILEQAMELLKELPRRHLQRRQEMSCRNLHRRVADRTSSEFLSRPDIGGC